MITRPTAAQLLEAVRRELNTNIAPAIDDSQLSVSLSMIDAILASVAIRCEHEIGWMIEDIASIERVADQVVGSGISGSAEVAEALDALRQNRSGSYHTGDLLADYDRAGEVLSRTLEAAMPAGGELRRRAEGLLDSRMDKATTIRGEFSLAGRE